MTTPRIEDILMDYCEPDTGLITIGKHDHDALRELLNKAHQAGIDEALATLYEVDTDKEPTIQDDAWANQYDSKAQAFWYGEAQAIKNIKKTLQDNK